MYFTILFFVTIIIVLYIIHRHRIRLAENKTLMRIKYFTTMLMEKNYEIFDNYLSEQKQYYLKKHLSQLQLEDNPLSDHFNKTRGKIVKFNNEEMRTVLIENNMGFFAPFINSLKIPYATDFVFNILEISPMKISEKQKSSPKMSVGYHYDNTCALNDGRDWEQILPCSVFVYYFDCPRNIKNGRLILRDTFTKKVLGKIPPKKNRLVEFKGDLNHGVETMFNVDENDNTKRISLVLEQYVVPDDFIKYPIDNNNISKKEYIDTSK